MSRFLPSFLYVADDIGYITEIINGARTAWNIAHDAAGRFSNVAEFGGCRALKYAPATVTATPPTTIDCQQWDPIDYDDAPWYADYGTPYPGTAYGFFITDISGLDGAHYTRSSSPIGSGRGGAVYGRLRARERVCKINVQLAGATEADLEFLFRWLEATLMGCCDACSSGANVLFRRYCPDLTGYDDGALADEDTTGILTAGLTMAKGGFLVEGPTWEAPPIDNGECYLRAASFTLGFADPCLYVVDESTGTTVVTPFGQGGATDMSEMARSLVEEESLDDSQTEAPADAWYDSLGMPPNFLLPVARTRSDYVGRAGAIVTISSNAKMFGGSPVTLPALRIVTYLPANSGSTNPSLSHRISELVLSGIPSGQIVEVNLHTKRVREAGSWQTGQWSDASHYVAYIAGQSRWASTDCSGGFLRVEPYRVTEVYNRGYLNPEQAVDGYTVTVLAGTRFSCPC